MNSKQIELHYHIYQNVLETNGDQGLLSPGILSENEQAKIVNAIKTLPSLCASVIEQYYLNEKTSKEIMQELSISSTQFYRLLHKGKFLLRNQLNPSFYKNANEILYGRKV